MKSYDLQKDAMEKWIRDTSNDNPISYNPKSKDIKTFLTVFGKSITNFSNNVDDSFYFMSNSIPIDVTIGLTWKTLNDIYTTTDHYYFINLLKPSFSKKENTIKYDYYLSVPLYVTYSLGEWEDIANWITAKNLKTALSKLNKRYDKKWVSIYEAKDSNWQKMVFLKRSVVLKIKK
jgi:hypothetical protein